jgi:hypothetical protein
MLFQLSYQQSEDEKQKQAKRQNENKLSVANGQIPALTPAVSIDTVPKITSSSISGFSNKNENNLNIDATEIKISPDDKYLSFINKNDLSLWLLEINNQ